MLNIWTRQETLAYLYVILIFVLCLLASHQGRSNGICIFTCKHTDRHGVLKDIHINIIVVTLFCNVPLAFSWFFSPLLITLLFFMIFSFSVNFYLFKDLEESITPMLTLHINSLTRQLFKKKLLSIIYGLFLQLQQRKPENNAPDRRQVPKS